MNRNPASTIALMPIEHRDDTFFLHSAGATYAIKTTDFGIPCHLHWGAPIRSQDLAHLPVVRSLSWSPALANAPAQASLNDLPLEFPAFGNSDFRSPAVEIFQPVDGSRIVDFRYVGHSIRQGKPALEGLPSTFVDGAGEAETLVLELRDSPFGPLRVELLYTIFANHPVVTRSVRLVNEGSHPVSLRRLLSCSLDFSNSFSHYQWLQLSGRVMDERHLVSGPLRQGIHAIESRRGASSHEQNPFMALAELGAEEEHGQVYGFNLVYSGNFLAQAELCGDRSIRAQIGINPFDFSWQLQPGESFQAPETVLVFSEHGLGGMSRALHRFYRQHLFRSSWKDKPRPVLVNNWEATYFDFDANKLETIASAAADLGIELFVLDDGWFGRRDNDRSSLGDWVTDRNKLPGGLEDLAARINAKGMQFGLWFEPEMVSPDSDLYREHPDWCIHVPNRPRTEQRHQLILDLSRPEVCEEIYQRVARVLRSVPIAYVKWDMNRNMTEVGSPGLSPERQQETAHRYMLGLYGMMERFITEFPEILFEGCAGGGGRFDPGILHYMPQIWTSDNTDAIARLKIQFGTSVAYPLSTISSHVSVVPNHQTGRVTPFRTRGQVAFTGAFGYELDLSELCEEDAEDVRQQTAFYKRIRPLLLKGDLFRLRHPGNDAAWMIVAPDRSEALVTHVNILSQASPPTRFLRMRGLDPARAYRVYEVLGEHARHETYGGDLLMQLGLPLPEPWEDFASCQWHLVACPEEP